MPTNQNYSEFLKSFRSKKFEKLWPAQDYMLRQYASGFKDKPDVAIELPTGAGKTLIALLIAEDWRRENRKVAILSANKTLARQMEMEAQQLGIPAVLIEGRGVDIPSQDKRDYHRANKIAVMNYWVYFNQNPVVDNADLLVMDDAHLAEHCLHSLWSVEIDRHEHNNLFKALVTELVNLFPEYTILNDALDDNASPTTPPELLSFIDQVSISRRFKEIVDTSPLLETDTDLKFRWNRLRNSLNEANIYLSSNSIWIRPYIYPLITSSHYAGASQRIYMSATIGEPSDLCRRLGTKRIEKIPVPEEFAETTSGRRYIVMNRIEEEDIPVRLQAIILTALRRCPKSVWLCTSKDKAEKTKQVVSEWLNQNGFIGHQSWLLSSLGDEIDQFKRADKGHLFVGGRFDGMDFRGDECRLVVLLTLPRAINIQEEFLCAYLRDANFMKRRLNQRIIQALGRCNRSDDDYAVYVLADRRFATHFGRESHRQGIPKNIIAEIDIAEDMTEVPVKVVKEKINMFLGGNFSDFDLTFRKMLKGVRCVPGGPTPTDIVEDEVLGWAAMFVSKNYNIAAQKFESCWEKAREDNIIELGAYYGWCWAKARYLESLQGDMGAREKALSILEDAINRGGTSAWFNRMKSSLNRERRTAETDSVIISNQEYSNAIICSFDNLMEQLGVHGTRFEKWCKQLSDELNCGQHNQYQQGLEKLGKLLGYDSTRPRHGSATDCRWRGIFGNCKEVVTLEVKIEDAPSGKIAASDIGQVHNQIARAKAEFETLGYTIRGSIVTHVTELLPDAESSAGEIRIITKSAFIELWNFIRQLLIKYRASWSLDGINLRRQAAGAIRPEIPSSGWLIRALNIDQRFITAEKLLEEWRR
jgi:hypothetical protein